MRICYFGIYDRDFGRNKVYMRGLRENGHEIIECNDRSGGLLKFWRLWKKHSAIVRNAATLGSVPRKPYDIMIVGYPGHIVVPFAKLIARALVVFDALSTLHEGEVISRGRFRKNPLKILKISTIDWLAAKFADLILVETDAQKEYFIKKFSLAPRKVVRIFTGADDQVCFKDPSVPKRPQFSAVFRGKFLPEAGVEYILEAAKILENQDIFFRIIGNGFLENEIKAKIAELKLKNIELISEHLSWDDLCKKMLECHVSLGQFGGNKSSVHERLERTIPHKAFESLAMGLPYLTGRARGISELLTDGKDAIMANCADPRDLATKLLSLKNNPDLLKSISENGHRLFQEKLTPRKLGESIVKTALETA